MSVQLHEQEGLHCLLALVSRPRLVALLQERVQSLEEVRVDQVVGTGPGPGVNANGRGFICVYAVCEFNFFLTWIRVRARRRRGPGTSSPFRR